MSTETQLHHLALLAELDALVDRLRQWSAAAPDWPPARYGHHVVERLVERSDLLRIRIRSPLVVATLGGTGVGKSTLVNALVGAEVSPAGRQRPTTRLPVLVCRDDLSPEALGIDPDHVQVVRRDTPALADLVLLDCPDPDTTDAAEADSPATNLARLRHLLPHCDVLLVVSTQQKYRSARVGEELAAAAPGAHLVFVQTHADVDENICDDWRRLLGQQYATGELFFVDAVAALADAQRGLPPRGDFARLLDLLARQLAGSASHRIRQANLVDLGRATLATCREAADAAMPAILRLETAIQEQRSRFAARLADQARQELLASRRGWEARLVAEAAARWGFSPFACVLRVYQGLGGLLTGAALTRVRSVSQLALLGAVEAGRRWQEFRTRRQADTALERAFDPRAGGVLVLEASTVLKGFVGEAQLNPADCQPAAIESQLGAVAADFIDRAGRQLDDLVARLVQRHTGRLTRWCYESALLVVLGMLLYRFGKNFFYDSWLAPELGLRPQAEPLLGFDFFLGSGVVLVVWCGLLLWRFTGRLRRGLDGELARLAQDWNEAKTAGALLVELQKQCDAVRAWRQQLDALDCRLVELQHRLASQTLSLGHRLPAAPPSAAHAAQTPAQPAARGQAGTSHNVPAALVRSSWRCLRPLP